MISAKYEKLPNEMRHFVLPARIVGNCRTARGTRTLQCKMADTEVPEVQETDETTECSKTEEPEANVEEGSKGNFVFSVSAT